MLTKIKLKNFKKFADSEISFAPGINVIVGKNEAGKSTLLNAIFTGLFTDATTKAKNFYDNAISWQTQSREITLELEFKTQKGEFSLTRDFKTGKQAFRNLHTNEGSDDYKKITEMVSQYLSIPAEDVFLSTACIRQAEITNIQFTKDLRTALQKVVSVSKEGGNIEHNLANLERELQQLKLGLDRPSRNQGPLKLTQLDLDETSDQLQHKRILWEKAMAAKQASDEGTDKLSDLEDKISELEKLFINYHKLEDGKKQLALIETQVTEVTNIINQVKSESLQLKQIENEMAALGNFNDERILQTSDELLKLRQSIKTNKELLAELEQSLEKVDRSSKINYLQVSEGKDKAKQLFELATGGVVAGGLLGAAGLTLNLAILTFTGFAVLALGMALLVVSIFRSLNAGKDNTKKIVAEDPQAEPLRQQLQTVNHKIKQQEEKVQAILSQYNLDSTADFFTRKARYVTLIDERKRLEHTINAFLNGKKLEEVEAKQVEYLTAQKTLETQVLTPEVRAADLSPNEYLRKRRELDMLLIERKRLEKDMTRNDVISEETDVTYDELVLLEEKFTMLTNRLENLQSRKVLLEQTIDLLKRVVSNTGQAASSVVSQEVEKYLPKLTAGRYKDLRLNENYDLEVFSSERNDWVKPIAKLSLGTVDQIYILARLALGKTLAGGKLRYLFLDDPFVTFDAERLENMKLILQELARETQIFLFTHNDQYGDWGQKIAIQ